MEPVALKGLASNVVVSGKRTLEAAEPYAKRGKRVCVLAVFHTETVAGELRGV